MTCPLNISSIRIIGECKNYGDITKAITAFDACISGESDIPNTDATKEYGKALSKLITAELTGRNDGVDDYILKTFHALLQNKNKIEINVVKVMEYIQDKELLKCVLVTPEISEWKYGESDLIRREETDRSNLFNPQLIQLCNNVERIDFYMNDYDNHDKIYTVSLIALLSIIEGTQIRKVIMRLYWKKEEGISWMNSLWDLHEQEIKTKYKGKGYNITYKFHEEYEMEDLQVDKL